MKKIISLLIHNMPGTLLMLICSVSFGQLPFIDTYDDLIIEKYRDADFFARILGSSYYIPEFSDALVYMNGSTLPLKADMRYNNLSDEMEFLQGEYKVILILDNKHTIDSIKLNGETFHFQKFLKEGKSEEGYFIIVYDGPCKLYMKKPIEYQEEKPEKGYQAYVPPQFVKKEHEFYLKTGDQPLEYLPRNSKKLLSILNEKGYDTSKAPKSKYTRESLRYLLKSVCSK